MALIATCFFIFEGGNFDVTENNVSFVIAQSFLRDCYASFMF